MIISVVNYGALMECAICCYDLNWRNAIPIQKMDFTRWQSDKCLNTRQVLPYLTRVKHISPLQFRALN